MFKHQEALKAELPSVVAVIKRREFGWECNIHQTG